MVAIEEPVMALPGRVWPAAAAVEPPAWLAATPARELLLLLLATSSCATHAPSAASGAIPRHRRDHRAGRAVKGVSARIELSIIVTVEQNR
jgi:hypothetical protein